MVVKSEKQLSMLDPAGNVFSDPEIEIPYEEPDVVHDAPTVLIDPDGNKFTYIPPWEEQGWKSKRGMMLLTQEIANTLPAMGTTEGQGDEAVAQVKFFTPDSSWTWYLIEFDPKTGECYGLVDGHEKELGYFHMAELMALTGPIGLHIERDKSWTPRKVESLM